MKKAVYAKIIVILFFCAGCATHEPIVDLSIDDVATQIKSKYESNLYQLPPRIQGHYGLRLYRTTGDKRYLNSALYDYYAVADSMDAMTKSLGDKELFDNHIARLTANISMGKRGKARHKTLKKYPEFVFYQELLSNAARLDEYGIESPGKVTAALASYDFKSPLKDKEMIEAWAAQLANYVYYLRQLKIVDHTQVYKKAFLKTYPDNRDEELSRWQFKNKIYGLTHFIFAASGYYQHFVSKSEFKWIFDYFEENKDRILKETSADVIAEVAICFLLTTQSENPFVLTAKYKIRDKFSVKNSMIPSVSGKIDIVKGEHRNVLAIMLFGWPEKLYAGPKFREMEEVVKYLPQSPESWENSRNEHGRNAVN